MKKYSSVFVCLCIFSFMLAGSAQAALTGNISGTIVDDTGNALPGVMVSVKGTGLPGVRTDTTREDGRYRIVSLPPGKYQVNAELPGFKTVEQREISVKINETSRINLQMQVSTYEEVVVVTAEAPVLDTKTSTIGVNINREFTERLPDSDNFQDAFAMGGGTTGGSNPFVHGGTHVDNLYLFDGVDSTDPVTHTFSANLNADAIEEVEVQTGGFSAEYGKAMGGIVNAVTKTGGNNFEGIIRFKFESDALEAPYDPGKPRFSTDDFFEPTFSLGGPIIKDKIWFFLSYKRSLREGSLDVRMSRDFETNEYEFKTVSTDVLGQFYVGKLTWSVTPSHNIEVFFSTDPMVWENGETLAFRPEAQQNWDQGGERYGANWTYIYSSNLYFDTKYGYSNNFIYITPQNDSGLPHVYDPKAKIHFDNYDTIDENDRSKWSVSTKATLVKDDWHGIHEFKTGFEFQELQEERYINYAGGRSYTIWYYEGDQNYSYHDTSSPLGQYPKQYLTYVDPKPSKAKGEVISFFLQDDWEFQPGLTLNIGLRFDQSKFENKLGEEVHTFDGMIAPRLGFAWDPNNDGKSKFHMSIGRYYNTYDLGIVDINPGPSTISQTWTFDPENPDAGEDGYYLDSESGGETTNDRLDPNTKPEYADEIVLGYDREIKANWSAGVMFIYKQTRDIIEDVGFWEDGDGNAHLATDVDINNQAAVDEWYDRIDEQGDVYYIVMNPSDAYRDYYSIELHSTARTDKFSFEVSYTHSRSEGTNVNVQPGDYFAGNMHHFTGYFDTPYLSDNIDGPLYYDVPHYLKLYASYRLPMGFIIGTHAWWKSGYIYEKYGEHLPGPDGQYDTEDDIHNEDPEYETWACRLIEGRGAGRLPDVVIVDLSIQKDIDFGKWGIMTAIIDIGNFLNNQVNLSRVEDESDWGRETGWAGPTTVTFQLKYEF
ncbi:TonB-dependent receptor domain-containing protein [candidate division CSSED10-310 bacterium]|uniref:TonB-dependent receptor domain-containing protein n=1 Tax=candidate division CSSED10-310 bacterium TaxID=2855610 RepID=A0ABV6YSB4_UNCC1